MKVSYEDNFHWSLSPMLVQAQNPVSKEHSSTFAADNKKNQEHHVRGGKCLLPI